MVFRRAAILALGTLLPFTNALTIEYVASKPPFKKMVY